MLMYESFLSNILKPITIKFVSAIVDFLNIVESKYKWSYKKIDDGEIWLYADTKNVLILKKLTYSNLYNLSSDFHYYDNYLKLGKNITNFLLHTFNKDYMSIMDISISDKDMSQYIKKLTIENYNEFLIKDTANKYNL